MAASYVYMLIHAPSRKLYIGSHKGNDLWSGYYTGSKVVQSMPRDEFIPVILSAHDTYPEAHAEEARLHEQYQVHKDDRFLNLATAVGKFHTPGPRSEETKRKISESLKIAMRGNVPWNAGRTHCFRGHEYTEENTHIRKDRGRECLKCRKLRDARRRKGPKEPITHCHRGHEFTEENTYIRPSGRRECRECRRLARHR